MKKLLIIKAKNTKNKKWEKNKEKSSMMDGTKNKKNQTRSGLISEEISNGAGIYQFRRWNKEWHQLVYMAKGKFRN